MYPKNAASPEQVSIGAVVQISDGAVQTSGCTVRIKPNGVAEGDGAGTTAYSTDGIVLYTPTQAETNYTSFILIAKKTGCIPVSITVVTTSSATPGTVLLAPVTHTSAVIPTVTTTTTATNVTTVSAGGISASSFAAGAITSTVIATDAIGADAIAANAVAEIQNGLATASSLATVAGYIDTEIQQILTNIAALNNLSAAQVNDEVLDVLQTDTFAELAAVPAATSSLKDKLTYVFMWLRNKSTQTSSTRTLFADNGSTTVAAETVSDDGTTYTKGEGA